MKLTGQDIEKRVENEPLELVGFSFSKSGKATPPNSVCLRYREYTDNECKYYKLDVFSYMFRSMQALLKAVEYFRLEDAKLCRAVQTLAVHCQSVTSFVDCTPHSEIVGSVEVLWESPRVQEALEKSSDFCSMVYSKEYVYEFNTLNFTKRIPLNSLI
jgi:hypothetical protein